MQLHWIISVKTMMYIQMKLLARSHREEFCILIWQISPPEKVRQQQTKIMCLMKPVYTNTIS